MADQRRLLALELAEEEEVCREEVQQQQQLHRRPLAEADVDRRAGSLSLSNLVVEGASIGMFGKETFSRVRVIYSHFQNKKVRSQQ